VGTDGKRRTGAFESVSDARAWLVTQRADVVRRTWKAPEAGRRTVGAYAADYLARTDLRDSTRDLYRGLWRHHLEHVERHPRSRRIGPGAALVALAAATNEPPPARTHCVTRSPN